MGKFFVIQLSKVWDFHGGDYDECLLQGCLAAFLLRSDDSEEHIASFFNCKKNQGARKVSSN
jgi:hypothetical protein